MFKIDLKPFKKFPDKIQEYNFCEEIPVREANADNLIFSGPVKVDVNVLNSNNSFVVRGAVRGQVKLKCSRCLEDYLFNVETGIDEIYRSAHLESGSESNEDVITFSGDSIDITPEIVKSVYMSLPMKAVCNPDCKGLCQHCGTNLNHEKCNCVVDDIDPRMAVLKGFLKDS